jgi:hypothetical protein
MCWQKNCDALAAQPGSEVSERNLSGERAACLRCSASSGFDLPLCQYAETADGLAGANAGDRTDARSLRVSEDSGSVEPRGLESGQEAGVSTLPRRRFGAAAQAEKAAACSTVSPRSISSNRCQSVSFPHRYRQGPCNPDGSIYAPLSPYVVFRVLKSPGQREPFGLPD